MRKAGKRENDIKNKRLWFEIDKEKDEQLIKVGLIDRYFDFV